MNRTLKWILLAVAAAVAIALLALMLRPAAMSVDTVSAERRTLTVSIEEQGRTRARLPYTVSAPVAGQLQRVTLVEGARVSAGDELARISIARESPRNEAAIRANLASAQARESAAEAAVVDAETSLTRARRESERRDRLFEQRVIGEEERDSYRQAASAAEARLLNARASVNAARADVDTARALLLGIDTDANGASTVAVHAPATGTIHRVHERSERVVQAGAPLFDLSDGDAMELVVDLLTQDAVRVSAGDRMLITGWGGDRTLQGQISYIEPEAFTKVSALGVEEQRVNVVGQFIDSDLPLGAGYRVEAAIVVSETDNVLTVSNNSLFRRDGNWHVFVVSDDRAQLQAVQIGQRSATHTAIVDGLGEGDTVIQFPSDQIEDGSRVIAR